MNIKEVKDLIQEILQSDISEFELEHTGTKVKLRRGLASREGTGVDRPPATVILNPNAPSIATPEVESPTHATTEITTDHNLHLIVSPIVGTFYRAPSPEAEPYVNVGDMVDEGSILCVVEAMKLMNEIPSDIAGEVVRIYVENGHPVEFGQKLFGLRARR